MWNFWNCGENWKYKWVKEELRLSYQHRKIETYYIRIAQESKSKSYVDFFERNYLFGISVTTWTDGENLLGQNEDKFRWVEEILLFFNNEKPKFASRIRSFFKKKTTVLKNFGMKFVFWHSKHLLGFDNFWWKVVKNMDEYLRWNLESLERPVWKFELRFISRIIWSNANSVFFQFAEFLFQVFWC